MSGDKLFIDTNIAPYLLSGDYTLAQLLNGNFFLYLIYNTISIIGL